jgi:hypothetical protein
MMLRPLSTYITWPVTADARGETRKAATLPTSCRGEQGKAETGGMAATVHMCETTAGCLTLLPLPQSYVTVFERVRL